LQYWLRDSGLLRFIVDTGTVFTVPSLLKDHPSALVDFLHLSGSNVRKQIVSFVSNTKSTLSVDIDFQKVRYGERSRQVVHVLRPATAGTLEQTVVFVHGGGWGTGFPALYRLVAAPFLERGMNVAVVGYRTYPDAVCAGQVKDLRTAVEHLRRRFPGAMDDVTLIGHSSGAHVSMMALLGGLSVDRFVGVSGVYDIPDHYRYEATRGVERISPLAPACSDGGLTLSGWRRFSPTQLLTELETVWLPPMLICHGMLDSTVPYTSSAHFVEALQQTREAKADLSVLNDVEHAETVLHLMFGGVTRDFILDWIWRQQGSKP
jgi:acetyl esterase/lipase